VPAFTVKQALENPQRDVSHRIVLPPASFLHEKKRSSALACGGALHSRTSPERVLLL
jgi:hypothetical protein